MYKASDVKELREKTQAGMLDCKKALEACEGDMDKAIDWLREKGISKAAKKEGRVAAEGVCQIITSGNEAVILEVNSETDFVAKNEEFTKFVDYVADLILKNDFNDVDSLLNYNDEGTTVNDRLINIISTIGEKISIRRFKKVVKNDNEVFGAYKHMGGRIGSLVVLENTTEEVAKDVAMHAAAMNPTAITREEVPAEMVEHEAHVIKEQVMQEGKPAEIAEKMVTGRLNKFYKEICLEEQPFVKDSGMTVLDYVKNNGGKIVSMTRFEVGEGIEKKEENFAEEVMNQIKG